MGLSFKSVLQGAPQVSPLPQKPVHQVNAVVHGDPDQCEKFGATLTEERFGDVVVPARSNRIALV